MEVAIRMREPGALRVLFIAGWGRSGSTLLGSILGQLPGFFFGGEIQYIWDRGLLEHWRCGCGNGFDECPTWTAVIREAFGSVSEADAEAMSVWCKRVRTRSIPAMRLGLWRWDAPRWRRDFLDHLSRLYRGIQTVTGCRVIIDGSKDPAYGYALTAIPGLEVDFVHLVRDPRASAYSWWHRAKHRGGTGPEDGRRMRRIAPWKHALHWDAWNLGAEILFSGDGKRYQRAYFEEILASPFPRLTRMVSSLVGKEEVSLPFITDHSVELRPTHSISGNPSRFETGRVELQRDAAWRRGLKPREKLVVEALTWPLMKRYGYLGAKRDTNRHSGKTM